MSEKTNVEHYNSSYGNFESELFSSIRSEVFGVDIGQNGWLTAEEQDIFIEWLELSASSIFLDIACGSGGPTLRIAQKTDCQGYGIDIHPQGIEAANAQALKQGFSNKVRFQTVNASQKLPFEDGSFDGLICIDAVNHLPERAKVFDEWARILRPGGSLVFTDPITVTGPLTNEEIRIRSSIGFFLFVPDGLDEELLTASGFEIKNKFDRTENMARIAHLWFKARQKREAELRKIEGDETFDGQQTFFNVTARLASERRLSRFAFQAIR